MFNYPATELFNSTGDRRVVWSQEEYESALAEGWTEERPAAAELVAKEDDPKPAVEPKQPKRR